MVISALSREAPIVFTGRAYTDDVIDEHATPDLLELAARYGVSREFVDWRGRLTTVSASTLIAVLRALDVDASTPDAIRSALGDTELAPWRRPLPASIVQRAGDTPWIFVHLPHGAQFRAWAVLEDGSTRDIPQIDNWIDPREVDGVLTGRATIVVPADMPRGWHELFVAITDDGATERIARCPLITVPERLNTAAANDETKRFGIMAQSYQLRSNTSWGIGDTRDLGALAGWGARQGASFVLVNPLHAPAPVEPIEPSPYLPTSRRFRDPLVLHLDVIPAVQLLEGPDAERFATLSRRATALNATPTIDRDVVWRAKREGLELLFDYDLKDPVRKRAFGMFCEREGQELVDFATYCALAEEFGADWRAWPQALHDVSGQAVSEFRDTRADRVEFWRWVQWLTEEQLLEVQRSACEAGMSLGIMHDLAVGVHPYGADSWAMPEALARGVSVGAPPDMFNQLGQNWSQPPWRPDRLAEFGYKPYRDMLRAALRCGGALRIDHILGLFRLWWIPEGQTPDAGCYVRYDVEAMLGILALEAERAGALVVGEDMGVVPPETRDTLAHFNIDGTSVLWFERGTSDEPLGPEHYRAHALVSVTTHDLPPTAGYLKLDHVRLRHELGLLEVALEDEIQRERATIEEVLDTLRARGALAPAASSVEEHTLALHRYLASSSARLMGVSLADLAGDTRSVNQPGTHREYPNWCVPLGNGSGERVTLEQVIASEWAVTLLEASRR